MAGWWKFQRDWLDDPVINKDADYLRVWIQLHQMAAFDDSREVYFKGKRMRLKAGQLTAGRYQLAELTGVHPSKVQRIIECFKSDHLIEHLRSSHTSLISIVSWDDTQKNEQQNEHLSNICQSSDNHLPITNKEIKNKRIKRNSYYSETEKERRARELDEWLYDAERKELL